MDAQTAVKKDLEVFIDKGGTIKYPFPIDDFALRVFNLDIQYEDFRKIFSSDLYNAEQLFGCLFPDKRYFQGMDKVILINTERKPFILNGTEIKKEYWADYAERQTIAHETGHYSDKYVHNRDICVSQLDLFEPTVFVDHPTSIIVYPIGEETFANRYARELLMPEDIVREEIIKRGLSGTFDINTMVNELKAKFGVTQFMIEIRLNELSIHFYL